ncbi:MAG TPA: hypothetical protein VHX59_24635 [Mycobacteriales bacterium]|nr:hypothetical protein [Mycobacteriales bacterium]
MADVRTTEQTADEPAPAEQPPTGRAVVITAAAAAALAIAYLLLGAGGTDLSAQAERAQFASRHGLVPIDFSWYGGTNQFGYSLVSQFVMAALGTRLTGALAAAASALALTALLARTGAKRPELGGVVAAVCIFGNLVSGRITYALGLAFALGALLALTDRNPRRRLVLAVIGALLASATSPVAGLFLGLAAAALIASHKVRDGLTLGIAAVVPIAVVSGLFGEGGWMNISRSDTWHGVVLSLVVLVFVPGRAVRIGAVLSALGVFAAYHVHTPVGLNAIRLAVMFCIPLLVARSRWNLPAVAVVVALVWWWVPPVMTGDLEDAGTHTAQQSYYTPLVDELHTLQPAARVEVPPTRDYWESVHVADEVPIARGWLRQLDIGRNPLFFNGTLTADSWHSWLQDNGVRYVALPDAQLSWVGSGEARLIRAGQPYLHKVWQGAHWQLYAVSGATGIAPGATVVRADSTSVTVRVSTAGPVPVKVRFSRWLTLDHSGACLRPAGRWSALQVDKPGTYRISSSLHWRQSARCPG